MKERIVYYYKTADDKIREYHDPDFFERFCRALAVFSIYLLPIMACIMIYEVNSKDSKLSEILCGSKCTVLSVNDRKRTVDIKHPELGTLVVSTNGYKRKYEVDGKLFVEKYKVGDELYIKNGKWYFSCGIHAWDQPFIVILLIISLLFSIVMFFKGIPDAKSFIRSGSNLLTKEQIEKIKNKVHESENKYEPENRYEFPF